MKIKRSSFQRRDGGRQLLQCRLKVLTWIILD